MIVHYLEVSEIDYATLNEIDYYVDYCIDYASLNSIEEVLNNVIVKHNGRIN